MQEQDTVDREHLKILSICHYVLAGFTLIPAMIGLFYMVIGVFVGFAIANDPHAAKDGPPPVVFTGIFAGFGFVFMLAFLTIGGLILKSGRNLAKRKGYIFSMVVACVIMLWFPFGTALGIFTLIVLSRGSVKELFSRSAVPQYGSTPPDWR